MPTRAERFIADSSWEMDHGAEFNSPTCAHAEVYYKMVFEDARRREPGLIMARGGKVAATIFQAEIRRADEWLPNAEAVISNALILVKNPNGDAEAQVGLRNGLLYTNGYLFVCTADYTDFKVRRPVRGENYEGYHFQNELRDRYQTYLTGLPSTFAPPVWGVRGDIKIPRLR